MRQTMRLADDPETVPEKTPAGRIRSAISGADWSERLEGAFPAAVDFERTQAAVGAGTLEALADDGKIDPDEAARLLPLARADEDASTARRVALERAARKGGTR